tara:strand:- start:26 stop:1207 length:1182 start_codon:yes stop_codon:yes gene_type:complete
MSSGFHYHKGFKVIGAVDRQNGKPSAGQGTLECNKSYEANIGIKPLDADLAAISPAEIGHYLDRESGGEDVDVLISCAPCTGFSRTIRKNLVNDDPRNSLVRRTVEFVEHFRPKVFVMENVGELLAGRFSNHFEYLAQRMEELGYQVGASVHSLDVFGLPQTRRRALVIACRSPEFELKTLEQLWDGYRVSDEAKTVRRAIASLPVLRAGETDSDDENHSSPSFSEKGLRRLELTPKDGGDWPDWLKHPEGEALLIPSMRKYASQGRVGPHRDVYGRLWWDRPAVTLKRECSHTGNGRYAHPEQNRLCSVREMGILQGFPKDYKFVADSLGNMYRHIGDAVPPLISYQIAHACHWTLTGKKPEIQEVVLRNTSLRGSDIVVSSDSVSEQEELQ